MWTFSNGVVQVGRAYRRSEQIAIRFIHMLSEVAFDLVRCRFERTHLQFSMVAENPGVHDC